MKTLHYLFVAFCLVLLNASCVREYMAPPLDEPKYTGNLDNISILQLKQRYASITAPALIEEDLIIKGIVVGNDESGNIYKQIYLQDASGAINIGIDQNAMYASYHVGQELYIHLKDLYVVKYGGELQIGMSTTNANRIAWQIFLTKAFANSWPNVEKAKPTVVSLNALTEDMVQTLVEIQDVRFTNGGTNAFTTGDATTNEQIRNDAGNVLDVRTSNFSDFAKDMLPVGKGTVVGILSRFNGAWQLFLRTKDDVKDFDGQAVEPEQPQAGTFFSETFGSGAYPAGNRPRINDFTDFDMQAPIQYSDESGWADIRSITGDNGAHIWLPATRDAIVRIAGINTASKGDVTLSFELAANLFEVGSAANTSDIQVRANGTLLSFTNQPLSNTAGDNSKFYTVTIPHIAQMENLTLEFVSRADVNRVGFRLDNIKLVGADANGGSGSGGPIVVNP